jgi:hypothetical protein
MKKCAEGNKHTYEDVARKGSYMKTQIRDEKCKFNNTKMWKADYFVAFTLITTDFR